MLSPSLNLLTSLGLLLTTTLALPTATPPFHVRAKQSAALSLPASTLPSPPPGTTLKYIALGLGTQNYTCASPSASSPPMSAGALATLYDATARLSLPSGAIQIPKLPGTSLKSGNGLGLPVLGQHHFTSSLVPCFDLAAASPPLFLSAHKAASAPAPADADAGPARSGAVDWLELLDDGRGATRGLSAVFRVETAGGKAGSCEGVGAGGMQVAYAAEYWFYG
ncbi:hypothetical protein BJ546DRAFT_1027278 [Cryomyces antarcticus]|nr:hypothetical protein LTR39_003605 [Cryomyces antarcticus]KAK5163296.1 hypothetical protein LTR04_002644 [Oleoguttula sp. CCFEE 6159]